MVDDDANRVLETSFEHQPRIAHLEDCREQAALDCVGGKRLGASAGSATDRCAVGIREPRR
jgi:hypothetical protein